MIKVEFGIQKELIISLMKHFQFAMENIQMVILNLEKLNFMISKVYSFKNLYLQNKFKYIKIIFFR